MNSTATTCIWQLPYCEFSVWGGDNISTASTTTTTTLGSGTTSGGGGGGGGAGGATTYSVTDVEFTAGYAKSLARMTGSVLQ